jgi:outer membrane immunogenic protein
MKMKKLVVTLTALAAFTGSALAADMAPRAYTKAPPPPPVAVVNWTGCYIGGGGGYGLWNQENTLFDDTFVARGGNRIQVTGNATTGGRGYFGTVGAGCDYQFAVGTYNLVVGAFGDYDFASEKGQLMIPATPLIGQEKLDQKWAIGGRIGWLVTPSLLTYFTGGYTQAHYNRVDFAIFPAVTSLNFMNGQTYNGYFLGAGDEYALNFLPGLFWKTEYRFSQFDTKTNPIFLTATGASVLASLDSKKYEHSVRSELVYRFNFGGPVVAKY